MVERVPESDYQSLHHFITDSPWDHQAVMSQIEVEAASWFAKGREPVGLLIDESGMVKSGNKSVGVDRQYIGNVGKTENGQVGVFLALNQGQDVGLIRSRLYLPKSWTDNPSRCAEAGVGEADQVYRTKPELALEMIRALNSQTDYDWIGGDSLYGNSVKLRLGLSEIGKTYLMDVGRPLRVYTRDPRPYLPKAEGKGRPHTRYQSDESSIPIEEVFKEAPAKDWKLIRVRKGTKGIISREVLIREVYVWSVRQRKQSEVEKLRLIASRSPGKDEIKYSLTNDHKLKAQALVFRQLQRHWVEVVFNQAKGQLGMAQYQVRTWRAWHHHIALTMLALHYILEQKLKFKKKVPMINCQDIKFYMAHILPQKASSPKELFAQIERKHDQREKDQSRYFP